MPSVLDLGFLKDGASVAKADLRRSLEALDGGLGHGGFWLAQAPGAVERPVGERLGESVSVRDFGALGDGVARPAAEHPSLGAARSPAAAQALGFKQTVRADQLDEQDTRDWLAFDLAIRSLSAKGGGVLRVPAGHYVFHRHLVLRDNVAIEGAGRDATILDNAWEGKGRSAYDRSLRGMLFWAGSLHPRILETSAQTGDRQADDLALAGPIEPGTNHLTLADRKDAARFKAGEIVLVADSTRSKTGKVEEGAPHYGQFNKVVSVDVAAGGLVCELPWRQPIQAARLIKLGTGRDGMFSDTGEQPWVAVQNIAVRRFTGRTTLGAMLQRSLVFRGAFEDFLFDGARGLMPNALNLCSVRRGEIRTRQRGLEVKFLSGLTEFEDLTILYVGTDKHVENRLPLVSIGEASDHITLRRCTFTDGGTADWITPRMVMSGYDLRLEDVTIVARRAGNVVMKIASSLDGTRVTGRNVTLVAADKGGPPSRFLRIETTPRTSARGGTAALVQIDGLKCVGKVTEARSAVLVDAVRTGSWIKRLELPDGAKLAGDGARNLAIVKASLMAPRAAVRDAADGVNASGKEPDMRVVLETGERLWAAGPEPFDPWMLTDEIVALRPGRTIPLRPWRWLATGAEGEYALARVDEAPWSASRPRWLVAGDTRLLRETAGGPLAPGSWRFGPPAAGLPPTIVVRLLGDRDPSALEDGHVRAGPDLEDA